MKQGRTAVLSVIALLAAGLWTGIAEAQARRGHSHHHHRHHFVPRVFFAAPLVYAVPRYYYPPAYYAPPPPVYIEQGVPPQSQYGAQPQLHSGAYWYCPAAGAYYPQAPSCPGGWQRVAPQ